MSRMLNINGLQVYYGGIHALHNVSMHIDEGEIVSIIGANGAGKSTLMRSIAGDKEYKEGTIKFLDEDLPVVMCHYPMATWPRKAVGALHLFGHIHANAPHINFGITEGDLMLNVGLDAPMANYGLINLKDIYKWYKSKLNGLTPREYIEKVTKENPSFVR